MICHWLLQHDGSLLLLETNLGILKEYPEVRWRVFEEVRWHTLVPSKIVIPFHLSMFTFPVNRRIETPST